MAPDKISGFGWSWVEAVFGKDWLSLDVDAAKEGIAAPTSEAPLMLSIEISALELFIRGLLESEKNI